MRRFVLSLATVVALLAALVVGIPGSPAAASSHDGTEVALTEADNGRTVVLALNQRLRVDLRPGSGEVWSDLDAGPALHRFQIDVSSSVTTGRFTALSPTTGQQVSASTDMGCFHAQPACAAPTRSWQVTVVVEDRQVPAAAPQQCLRRPVPSLAPGYVLAEERSDGQTIRVPQGDRLLVLFEGCKQGGVDYQPAEGGGPLFRDRASGRNPGGATSEFLAVSLGTTTVTAVRDAPCLHVPNGCAITAQVWQITVEVVPAQPCSMTGPATAVGGSTVRLNGRVGAGDQVRVWFRPYGGTAFVVRRVLTAGPDGFFSTTYAALVDQRWFATADRGCTTPAGLTQVSPAVVAPALVKRGSNVSLQVRGFAGQEVRLYALRAGGVYRLVRVGRLDGQASYRTAYVADVDHRFYALTGPNARRSPAILIRAT